MDFFSLDGLVMRIAVFVKRLEYTPITRNKKMYPTRLPPPA